MKTFLTAILTFISITIYSQNSRNNSVQWMNGWNVTWNDSDLRESGNPKYDRLDNYGRFKCLDIEFHIRKLKPKYYSDFSLVLRQTEMKLHNSISESVHRNGGSGTYSGSSSSEWIRIEGMFQYIGVGAKLGIMLNQKVNRSNNYLTLSLFLFKSVNKITSDDSFGNSFHSYYHIEALDVHEVINKREEVLGTEKLNVFSDKILGNLEIGFLKTIRIGQKVDVDLIIDIGGYGYGSALGISYFRAANCIRPGIGLNF